MWKNTQNIVNNDQIVKHNRTKTSRILTKKKKGDKFLSFINIAILELVLSFGHYNNVVLNVVILDGCADETMKNFPKF